MSFKERRQARHLKLFFEQMDVAIALRHETRTGNTCMDRDPKEFQFADAVSNTAKAAIEAGVADVGEVNIHNYRDIYFDLKAVYNELKKAQ